MSFKLLILAVLMVTGLPAVASAQSAADRQKQEKACSSDVNRHCRKVMKEGDQAIFSCLQANRSKLSASCRRMVEQSR